MSPALSASVRHTFARTPAGSLLRDTLQLGTLTPSLQHALRNYWWSHREGEKRGLYQDPILHRHSQHHWQRPAPGLQACSELLLCLALSQHDSTQTIQHTESVGDEQ